jgi:hypothetical protein
MELLKLGIDIGQTSVAKYIARRSGLPSQGWKTFLRNHADGTAAMDLFVVPTISFRLLYGLLIMGHCRRQIRHLRHVLLCYLDYYNSTRTHPLGVEKGRADITCCRDSRMQFICRPILGGLHHQYGRI